MSFLRRINWESVLRPALGAVFGLGLGLALCWAAGEDPWHVLKVLIQSGFGSGYDFGMMLFYSAPLLLTGLAVAIPFRAGLFNIGAEGQLMMGSLASAWAASALPDLQSPFLAFLWAAAWGFLVGGIWGLIPGLLKAKRGSHEVITTIMLNFVAAGVTSYFTLYTIKDPESSQAESILIAPVYQLKPFEVFTGAPMGPLIFGLVLLVVFFHFWVQHSRWGFQLKSVGENERASHTYGISKSKVWMSSLFVSGGLAGWVGLIEVLGNSHRFKMGFSADYGFVGIAVALVARGNLLGILPAALMFGWLQKGSASLDLETEKVTRDLSYIIQGLIILGVSADGFWKYFLTRRKAAQ